MKKGILLIVLIGVLFGCKTEGKDDEKNNSQTDVSDMENEVTEVKAVKLLLTDFNHEIISNGTVSARKKADLKFPTSENLQTIFVRNGDRVYRGQKIAELEKFKLEIALKQAKESLEKSRLEMQDVLIGQGYSPSDSTKIPEAVMKLARLRSGYDSNKNQYELANYNYKNTTLYAPFDGVVANLFTKEYNPSTSSDAFCTIVDNRTPEVVFMVLESELSLIKRGDKVKITPFADSKNTIDGTVSEINPVVDKNGMVRVMALAQTSDHLYDGMNVKVRTQRQASKQLVIPKEALVLRSNRKVVFKAQKGQAIWVYVETGSENSYGYVVTDGLVEGDSIIYDGNINLAHESPIKIIP